MPVIGGIQTGNFSAAARATIEREQMELAWEQFQERKSQNKISERMAIANTIIQGAGVVAGGVGGIVAANLSQQALNLTATSPSQTGAVTPAMTAEMDFAKSEGALGRASKERIAETGILGRNTPAILKQMFGSNASIPMSPLNTGAQKEIDLAEDFRDIDSAVGGAVRSVQGYADPQSITRWKQGALNTFAKQRADEVFQGKKDELGSSSAAALSLYTGPPLEDNPDFMKAQESQGFWGFQGRVGKTIGKTLLGDFEGIGKDVEYARLQRELYKKMLISQEQDAMKESYERGTMTKEEYLEYMRESLRRYGEIK